MNATATTGLTLDTGALLALDHPGKAVAMQARLDEARRRGGTICIPVEVVAQAWRSSRQARLARLLKSSGIDIAVMTLSVARSVGLMCAAKNRYIGAVSLGFSPSARSRIPGHSLAGECALGLA